MKTIEERAEAYASSIWPNPMLAVEWKESKADYIQIATEQKAIDEAHPSDAVIMRILNAIGYEEESWIPIVRKNLKAMEE